MVEPGFVAGAKRSRPSGIAVEGCGGAGSGMSRPLIQLGLSGPSPYKTEGRERAIHAANRETHSRMTPAS